MEVKLSWAVGIVVSLMGCQGVIGSPAAIPDEPDVPTILDPETECEGRGLTLGVTPIRRLTRAQYINSVQDALELTELPESMHTRLAQIPDGKRGSFANTTTSPSLVELNLYLDAADALTAEMDLATVRGCEGGADCVATIIARLGRRLFRRSLSDDEQQDYLDLFTIVEEAEDTDAATAAIITALISSPSFLYREEPVTTDSGALRPLTDVALASRISFLFWQSGPDEALLDVAEAGTLASDPAELESQARRLLADARSQRGIRSFVEQWSGTTRLQREQPDHPDWNPALGDSMREETARFVQHVTVEGDGTLRELLTANYTFVDVALANLYGIDPPDAPFEQVTLPAERSGILTHPSVLAAHGEAPAEIRRGQFVRDQLLCAPHFELPPAVVADPEVDRLVTRPCVGCHQKMDYIGFGFAQFDRLGGLQAPPEGTPTPEIFADTPELEPLAGPFEDASELAQRLSQSEVVEACVARHWSRFASGRVESAEDTCAIYEFQRLFTASGGDIPELMVAIATSEWFAHRSGADVDAAEQGAGS